MKRMAMSELDIETYQQLSLAPASEIIAAARSDNLQVNLTMTKPQNITLGGKPLKIRKWTPLFKARKPDIVAELLIENSGETGESDLQEVILADFEICPACGHEKTPAPAIQVANLKRLQRGRCEIGWWSDDELARLEHALQPGDLIIPDFYQSCTIRRANGRLETWPRCQ